MVASWWPCCCGEVNCQFCADDIGPAQFVFTVSGFTNEAIEQDCENCVDLNGSYVLDFVSEGESNCTWYGEFETDCGTVEITCAVYEFSVAVTMTIGTESVEFSKLLLSSFDCMNELLTGLANTSLGLFPCDPGSTSGTLVAA